jgi:thioredoxin-related protein
MMKKLLLTFFLVMGVFTMQAQEIRWMSLDEALAKQKKNPKPIFMEFYTDWFAQCKMFDANTLQNPEVAELINRNYYAVKFNAEGNSVVNFKGNSFNNPNFDPTRKGRNSAHELTTFLKVEGYPSIYILNRNGEVQEKTTGFKTPEELLRFLK